MDPQVQSALATGIFGLISIIAGHFVKAVIDAKKGKKVRLDKTREERDAYFELYMQWRYYAINLRKVAVRNGVPDDFFDDPPPEAASKPRS